MAIATLLGVSTPLQSQELGLIVGQVSDQANAITLPGIPVELTGPVSQIEYTDLDGRYRFEVPAGTYELKVVMSGYAEQNVTLEVGEGQTSTVQVSLVSNAFEESLVVTAVAVDSDTSSADAQLKLRMNAPTVQDNMGASEMSANDDSSAADAMERVTGVSVVGGDAVFVRGLGERYSTTTLGGATLPTTEPDRRVVPLDMFPTGLIDSVSVSKTYSPDKPAQFAGGLVEIVPLRMPVETSFEAGFSGGWNSLTTGTTGLSYPSGGREWTGFDDGSRSLPAVIPSAKVVRGGRFTNDEIGFLQDELSEFGESFSNVWDTRPKNHPIDQSYDALFGGRFGKFGVVSTFRHGQKSSYVDETQTFFNVGANDSINVFNGPYDFGISEFERTLGLVGNLTYQFNANHRLSFGNFYTHAGRDQTREFEGFNSDASNDIRSQRLFFVDEAIRSHNIGGDHLFPQASNSRIDWQLTLSNAGRSEPDLRETLYEFDVARGSFVLADESQSGLRQFNDQVDDSTELNVNYSMLWQQWNGMAAQLKFGAGYLDRNRDFQSRRFRLNPLSTIGLDLSRPAEELFSSANIQNRNFQLKEETRNTDAYAGEQEIGSFYGMVDVPLSVRLRFVGGARVENFKQTVDTFDPFIVNIGGESEVTSSQLHETDVFPSTNFVYALGATQNLRIGYSTTVNRPEFRELAPFEFTDVVGGRATIGNADLEQSIIQNVDLRWEWFPKAEEVISASFFYKHFDKPIERIVEPTAQLRTSYTNALSAKNAGFEVEVRKALHPKVSMGMNYSYVDSEITLDEQAGQVQTSNVRPLAGTSENLFNAMAEFRLPDRGFAIRVLWNYFGDRILDVGSLGLPDIIQEGRNQIDLILSQRWTDWSVKVALDNLANDDYLFTQGGLDQRVFSLGRSISLGFSYHP